MKGLYTFALAVGLVAGTTALAADVMEKTVTEKTTTTSYSGTVSAIDPSAHSFVIKSETSTSPTKYSYTEKTTFIDESGNTVTYEAIRDRPVTVYYTKEGDQMVVSRVVVNRPTAGVIQRKETTTEEREVR